MSDIKYRVSRFTFYVLARGLPLGRFTQHVTRNMRYIAAVVLLFFLGLAFWFLLSPRDDGSMAEIRRRGTLRVGLDASFPPFETIDASGQIVGLDVDIARTIAVDMGVEAEFVNIAFDGLYDALLARRVDLIISGLPYDPRWTEDVAYTSNYFNAGQVLVTRAEDPAIQSVEDLAGRIVAVEWGSQAEMEGRRLAQKLAMSSSPSPPTPLPQGEGSTLTLLRQDSAATALEAVRNGQADAAIVDAPSALPPSSTLPLSGRGRLKILTYLTDEWYAAAVHRQSRELLAAVNQTLARLEANGEMAKLEAKWFK